MHRLRSALAQHLLYHPDRAIPALFAGKHPRNLPGSCKLAADHVANSDWECPSTVARRSAPPIVLKFDLPAIWFDTQPESILRRYALHFGVRAAFGKRGKALIREARRRRHLQQLGTVIKDSAMKGQLVEVRAVRVICDTILKDRVLTELNALGATGFTAWPAYGEGTVLDPGWPSAFAAPNRIYVEVWCKRSVAERILEYCEGSKFEGIGMIAGIQPLWIHEREAANLLES